VAPAEDVIRRERFEALVGSAYVPLQRYLRRRTDRATADDVLGDVLLVMWRRVDDVPTDLPLPWCYGVARGCLANAARGARRHRQLLRRLAEQPQPDTAADTDDPDLESALAGLPPTDQEVLRLWAWEQLPPREIAVALGITPNAASIRLHRATRRLRQGLGAGKEVGQGGQVGPREGTEAPR
jgi:RNA polymerase sigma-70 factor (ECF subfamily)